MQSLTFILAFALIAAASAYSHGGDGGHGGSSYVSRHDNNGPSEVVSHGHGDEHGKEEGGHGGKLQVQELKFFLLPHFISLTISKLLKCKNWKS